jgi:hypothetical protein
VPHPHYQPHNHHMHHHHHHHHQHQPAAAAGAAPSVIPKAEFARELLTAALQDPAFIDAMYERYVQQRIRHQLFHTGHSHAAHPHSHAFHFHSHSQPSTPLGGAHHHHHHRHAFPPVSLFNAADLTPRRASLLQQQPAQPASATDTPFSFASSAAE